MPPTKRSPGLVELALKRHRQTVDSNNNNNDALSSVAPSLTASEERHMIKVFRKNVDPLCPATPLDSMEKCSQWITASTGGTVSASAARISTRPHKLVAYSSSSTSTYSGKENIDYPCGKEVSPVGGTFPVSNDSSVSAVLDTKNSPFTAGVESNVTPCDSHLVSFSNQASEVNDAPKRLMVPLADSITPPVDIPVVCKTVSGTVAPNLSGSIKSVKKNLFPDVSNRYLEDLSGDLDGALILPLDDPVNWEGVMRIEVVNNAIDNESFSVLEESETAEITINERGKQRKRSNTPSDKTPPRKRRVTPANWKSTRAKQAHIAGLAHTSEKGREKKARVLKPPCSAKCRKGCSTRVSQAIRQAIFDKYWSFQQDKTGQWLFLAKLVKTVPIKRRKVTVDDEEEAWRKHTYDYYLTNLEDKDEDPIPVCQTMFLNAFDISTKSIRGALSKNSPDKRGKHILNRSRTSASLIDGVKEHIKKFPLVESHYSRADSQRKYLDEHLTAAQMYRMYLMGREEGASSTATERQYRDIFNSSFNIGFFKPKKDQCSLCLGFNDAGAVTSEEKVIEYNQHCQEKKRIRELKKADKLESREANSNIRVVTYDMQKNLYCPKGDNAEFYYKRKLSSFNFTLFDCTVKQAYCYVCLTQGRKGADEVSSFVLDYVQAMVEKGVKEFKFYSDSCTGQNKNKFLFSMYFLAAMKFNVKMSHSWLVKGHTQMECDSVHARIEKRTKNLQIFTPAQWYGNIKSAKVRKPAYIVKEANKDVSISSFKPLAMCFNWGKVPISKLRIMKFDSNDPSNISYRTECDGEIISFPVLSKRVGRRINFLTYKLKKAYSGILPLKPKVLNDLKWYVSKGFIPEAYLGFYQNLFEEPPDGIVEDEDEDEDDVPQEVTPVNNMDSSEYLLEDLDDQIPLGARSNVDNGVAAVSDCSDISDEDDN